MAAERGARAKTENLSLRLDPKSKFALEFVARLRGQSITAVVERSIIVAADQETIPDRYNDAVGWKYFWDPSEGVRTLKLLSDPGYPSNYEEDEIRRFTLDHWQFFYQDKDGKIPLRGYVDILWPNINKYVEYWHQHKTRDYWAAGKLMKGDLNAAQIAPPEWPASSGQQRPGGPVKRPPDGDLDDDIPF